MSDSRGAVTVERIAVWLLAVLAVAALVALVVGLWATDSDGLPVTEGDSITVDDPRTDSDGDGGFLDGDVSVGFVFDSGDTVEVVWTGRILGTPEEQSSTLGTVTVTNETG